MSFAPRIASVPAVALAATLLLGPLGAAPARPAPKAAAGTPIAHAARDVAPASQGFSAPHDAPALTQMGVKLLLEQLCGVRLPRMDSVIRSLCVLALTMNLSPVDVWYVKPQTTTVEDVPPVDTPPPSIPPPPNQPTGGTDETPPPPPPLRVPEPATITSALIGASLAGLAWWRRRRRDEDLDEQEAPPDSLPLAE